MHGECYDAIVVDTSPFFHGPMLATLDRTDELLVLCGLDVPTLKNVRLALQTLELLSFPSRRIRYVLNRANSKVGLNKREVEDALKVTVHASIPSDRIVPIAVNRGTPAVLSEPGSEFAQGVDRACYGRHDARREAGEAAQAAEPVEELSERWVSTIVSSARATAAPSSP